MRMRCAERDEAKARGEVFYFTGEPCPRGHVSKRYVSAFKCYECSVEERKAKAAANAEAKDKRPLSPRRQAMAEGRTRYRTGKPCSRGHDAERLTVNGSCVVCNKENAEANSNGERDDAIKAYRVANRERYRAHARNRRARLKVQGSHTADDVYAIFARQEGRCVYCDAWLIDWHLDHRTPISRGGSNGPENLQITCPTCNLKKHNKTHEEYLKSSLVSK